MRFEFSIKDKIWNKLPKKWRNKELCIECFLEELEKENPNQTINLIDFYYLGIVGILDNSNINFGGIIVNSDNKKNQRIILENEKLQ